MNKNSFILDIPDSYMMLIWYILKLRGGASLSVWNPVAVTRGIRL